MAKDIKVKLYSNSKQFNSEMSSISRQMKVVKSEFEANRSSVDNWGNQLKQSESRIKFLNQNLELQRKRVSELRKAYNDSAKTKGRDAKETQNLAVRLNHATAAMNKTRNSITQTTAKMKSMQAATRKTAMGMKQFGDRMNRAGMQMRGMGMSVGIVSGTAFYGLVRAMKSAYDATAEFESGMSAVEALSGATASEMKLLDKQARDLGASTRFTATQATEGMQKLALAGWDATEIMQGMPGMLDLAAAGSLDLSTAADITSDTMQAFKLSADKAGHAADVFAYAQANANTNVEQLGDAMQYIAPVANSLGWELEESAAAVMKLSDAGIKGGKAGQAFSTSLSRLAKPTSAMKKEMKKLGMEFFDAEGNMKPLPGVMEEIEKGTKGMTKEQKASTLSTLFGAQAYKHWAILLEEGSGALAETTEELKNADGAAKEMADTMMDNAAGKVIEFKSAIEGLQISVTRGLMPAFSEIVEQATGLVRGFTEMDESTQKTIVTTVAMTAAVLGVTTVVAGLVAAVGAFLAFAGPVGLAITAATALLGGLAIAITAAKTHTNELEKANLDNAESLNNQAIELEHNADTFDKLSGKAKISNSELATLHDLNNRISKAKNSDEVAKLQGQYDELAKKSGLSKDELKDLFEANDNIIAQSPDVKKSVSEQGNAFAENTEAVREYIETLYEMSLVELDTERQKALKEQEELQKKITEQKKGQINLDKQLTEYNEANKMSQKEIEDRLKKIKKEKHYGNLNTAEGVELQYEEEVLTAIIEGNYQDQVDKLMKKKEEGRENIANTEEEISKNQILLDEAGNILLKQAGINEEGEKGVITLEKKLAKNKEALADLDAENEKNGKLTDKQQEKYDKLTAQNERMQEAQDYLNNELELYGSVNSLIESQKEKLSEGTQERIKSLEKTHGIEVAEGNILEQIQKKNGKLVEERDQLEENREKQGANKKEIDKQIAAIDEKINAGDGVILQMLEELDILDLVKEGIQLNGDELQAYLEGLGYTTEEAFNLAKELSGETVEALKEGTEESKKAGKDKGDKHKEGLDSTREPNKFTATGLVDNIVTEFNKGSDKTGKSGKQKGEEHRKGIFSTQGQNASAAKTLIDSVLNEVDKGDRQANQSGKNKGTSHNAGLSSTKKLNEITGKDLTNNLLNQIKKGDPESNKAGKNKGTAHKSGLQGTSGANTSAAGLLSSNVTSKLGSTTDGGGGSKAGSLFKIGLGSWGDATFSAAANVANRGVSGLKSVKTSGAGSDFVSGFRGSISTGGGSVWSAAWSLGKSALSALKKSINSHSPSKETGQEGSNFVDGFSLSMDKNKKKAIQSASDVGRESLEAFKGEVDSANDQALLIDAAAREIKANKNILVVKHEVENKGLENDISGLTSEMKELAMMFKQMLQVQTAQLAVTSEQPIVLQVNDFEMARAIRGPLNEMNERDTKVTKDFRG